MINGRLDHFLDTGWFSESTLFLNGYVYWCEAQYDPKKGTTTFFIDKWAATNEDDTYFHTLLEPDGTCNWNRVLEIEDNSLDRIKQKFLQSPVFDGKAFWQVEKEIAWLDEDTPIYKS